MLGFEGFGNLLSHFTENYHAQRAFTLYRMTIWQQTPKKLHIVFHSFGFDVMQNDIQWMVDTTMLLLVAAVMLSRGGH